MSGIGNSSDAPPADAAVGEGRVADDRVDTDPVTRTGPAGEADEGDPAAAAMTLAPVRSRVVELAAGAMTGMAVSDVPTPLRRVAQFTPRRRARLASAQIAAQLASDPVFRQRIATRVVESATHGLAAEIAAGRRPDPAVADPVEVAALAYLLRPAGWSQTVATAVEALRREQEQEEVAAQVARAKDRAARAEHDLTVAKVELEKLRGELTRAREESTAAQLEVRRLSRQLRQAQADRKRAEDLLATERGRAARAAAEQEAELRRLRTRLAESQQAVGQARAAARQARAVDDIRLGLLLDTLERAARGLRRELALEPPEQLPADIVATEHAVTPTTTGRPPARGLAADDPARLDHLLALPRAHLLVDGYNVTKQGFGGLSLEQQRHRLVAGLSGLAARSGAEVTVVFDGAERQYGLPAPPRGVRVLFSLPGQTADDLIRELVREEPGGRPVVVVSSDREVADGVRRAGAYPLPADALLRRLERA